MSAVSFILALYLRLGEDFHSSYSFLIPSTLIFTAVCTAVFFFTGLYRGIWRYASMQDLLAITKAVTLATLIFLPLLFMITRLDEFPRSVLAINWLLLLALLGGPRFLYRLLKDGGASSIFGYSPSDKRIAVLMVGVSDSALHFLRESNKKTSSNYKVVGIIDNDKSKIGGYIHDVKVYGNIDNIPKIIKRLKREARAPQRIILAQDYLDNENIEKLLKITGTFGLTLAKLPRISDFKSEVDRIEIKPIAIEDLLGRPQKAPNLGRRKELIKNKTILITGAGGTIGSELTRQIASFKPKKIVLLEISEFNLYKITSELDSIFPKLAKSSLICDIRDFDSLNNIFRKEKPDIVFHAAALKHVPIVEDNLSEAILTNIGGSKNVADLCIEHKIDKMVMVSTDKAVNPTSLMGATKRVAECYVQSLGSLKNCPTSLSTVRFGNVLGSSGSVIPLFQKQLENGGPITVTHPDMERFFMTVPEAVELILQASTLNFDKESGKSGIFVLDMGTPIKIKDLATQMIKLAGLRPEIDIKIEYTGIRRGEKLYEELFYDYETSEKTLYEGIMRCNAKILNYKDVLEKVEKIKKLCKKNDKMLLINALTELVPEYKEEVMEKKAA